MKVIIILIIALAAWFIIKSVTFVRVLLTVVLSVVYIPINKLNTAVQSWYFGMKEKDKIVYYAFTPFYWIIVAITFIISVPYEFVIAMDLH